MSKYTTRQQDTTKVLFRRRESHQKNKLVLIETSNLLYKETPDFNTLVCQSFCHFILEALDKYSVVLLIRPSQVLITKKLQILADAVYSQRQATYFDITQILEDF
jgi:hypothetical protein